MTHASLFSGIGGFDLAAHWIGWQNLFHCEIDKFCRTVLKYYWPGAITYDDIDKTNFTVWRGRVDVLTGGFPCQPFSVNGKRKATGDARYKWPEMLRAIREISPQWLVFENVSGFVNWSRGMALEILQSDLEIEGYQTTSFIIPACAVNAPHERKRVWIIARRVITADDTRLRVERHRQARQQVARTPIKEKLFGRDIATDYARKWITQPAFCSAINGVSLRLDGITFSEWRRESLKAYGNAIVPQIAYEIFKAIKQCD